MAAGEPWDADLPLVKSMWQLGHSDETIAIAVGRSRYAVKKLRQVMGWVGTPGPKAKGERLLEPEDAIDDTPHVEAILAHGGFTRALLREQAAAELRRRGIAA